MPSPGSRRALRWLAWKSWEPLLELKFSSRTPSEAQRHANRQRAHGGSGEEVDLEVRLPSAAELRIDAPEVRRGEEVAAREGHLQRRRPERVRPGLGREIGQRGFAQLQERAVLDVARIRESIGGAAGRHGPRLLEQRSV